MSFEGIPYFGDDSDPADSIVVAPRLPKIYRSFDEMRRANSQKIKPTWESPDQLRIDAIRGIIKNGVWDALGPGCDYSEKPEEPDPDIDVIPRQDPGTPYATLNKAILDRQERIFSGVLQDSGIDYFG